METGMLWEKLQKQNKDARCRKGDIREEEAGRHGQGKEK